MTNKPTVEEWRDEWRKTKAYRLLLKTWGDEGRTCNGYAEDFIETLLSSQQAELRKKLHKHADENIDEAKFNRHWFKANVDAVLNKLT